ncbi:MAG: response regulator [Anaerolineae bacterium]|nr:response regulator [Anaerolineae bacterium]
MAGAKILVVANKHSVIKRIEAFLLQEGYTVLMALGGEEGIRLVAEEAPDVVLLEEMSSQVTGLDVLNALKERAIPARVVIMTARYDPLMFMGQFIRGGACAFLGKPFQPADLVAVVEQVLALRPDVNLYLGQTPPIMEDLLARVEKIWEAATTQ